MSYLSRLIFVFVFLISGSLSWAQLNNEQTRESLNLRPNASAGQINLKSTKGWSTARWYVVGEFQKDSIRWLDGEKTPIEWNSDCNVEKINLSSVSQINRPQEIRDSNFEVLRYAEFVAFELNPVQAREKIELQAKAGSLECLGSFELAPKWSKQAGGPRPLFFIKATGNFYYGKKIDIDYVQVAERADVLIDLMAGYAQISLPNRHSTRKSPLHFLPIVTSRFEWMPPDQTRWGLVGSLDQTLYSFGGSARQTINISDWTIGLFHQRTQRLFQGFVWRLHARLLHHLVDDFNVLRSVANENDEAIYLPLGLSGQFYIGRRFSTGFDFVYAFENNWAGQGVGQSFYMAAWKTTYRINSVLLFLGEMNYRSYVISGMKAENLMGIQAGLRFEL